MSEAQTQCSCVAHGSDLAMFQLTGSCQSQPIRVFGWHQEWRQHFPVPVSGSIIVIINNITLMASLINKVNTLAQVIASSSQLLPATNITASLAEVYLKEGGS